MGALHVRRGPASVNVNRLQRVPLPMTSCRCDQELCTQPYMFQIAHGGPTGPPLRLPPSVPPKVDLGAAAHHQASHAAVTTSLCGSGSEDEDMTVNVPASRGTTPRLATQTPRAGEEASLAAALSEDSHSLDGVAVLAAQHSTAFDRASKAIMVGAEGSHALGLCLRAWASTRSARGNAPAIAARRAAVCRLA